MDRAELLECMRDAVEALAEFRHHLPHHSPAAHGQVEIARQHLGYAMNLLRQTLGRGDDDDRPPLRLAR